MEYETIKINGIKIKAIKMEERVAISHLGVVVKKVIYIIPLDIKLYKMIPDSVKINNKKFYKTDIVDINQKNFKLIEM